MDEVFNRAVGSICCGILGGIIGTAFISSLAIAILLYIAITGFVYADRNR